jgi:hypothetical protein
MALDAQSLVTAANSYNRSPGEMQLIKLGLLQQTLLGLNPTADVTAQALIAVARDYERSSGEQALIELGLLKQILLVLNPAA